METNTENIKIFDKIIDVRNAISLAKQNNKLIGFVPTMGALHEGHLSLIKSAKQECEYVVVSIFVNPIQFGPNEDYQQYPRPIEHDIAKCKKTGVNLLFNPTDKEMYPQEQLARVYVKKLTENLCGISRPGHFEGVTTVVTKLFNIIQPDIAYFGQKDAQQALIIRRMAIDLNMPIKIRICPTIREHDGLAMSSRNQYLNEEQRKQASCLYNSLCKAKEMIRTGERKAEQIIKQMREIIEQAGPCEIDYIKIVDTETIEDINTIGAEPVLIALAVKIGPARLIDNIIVNNKGEDIILT